ncbi:DUF4837 family protein [Bacteroidota bacterium]
MKYLAIVIISVLLVISGCDTTIQTGSTGSGTVKPNVTGGAGEILVVMDKFAWDSQTGESLKDILKEEIPALPQSEPLFDVTQISSASFDNLFRYHRSVVLVTINKSREEPAIRFRKNVWAKPQIVVQMEAASNKELNELILENKDKIKNFLVQYDRQRLTDSYVASKDLEIQKLMANNHQIRLGIPRGYNIDIEGDEYTSVSIETPDFSQVLHVYEYPAEDKAALSTKELLKQRNVFTAKYVKGPRENSYMQTAEIYPPVVYDLQLNGNEVVEIRGLWELENGFMGGPFVSHSIYDESRHRIVTVEGYVYYPNQKKRIKIRQLEAIIYTLEII